MAIALIVLFAPAAAQAGPTGSQGLFVAQPTWEGAGPSASLRSTLPTQMRVWSGQSSAGAFIWDPVSVVRLRLREPLAACWTPGYRASWVAEVNRAAREIGYDLARDYSALAISMPEGFAASCLPRASAVGWKTDSCRVTEPYDCGLSLYSASHSTYPIVAHETGHTLGLKHANALNCKTSQGVPVPLTWSGKCLGIEYGDSLDLMGKGMSAPILLNSAYADRFGWLNKSAITRISAEQEAPRLVSLNPYGALTGNRALAIEMPGVPRFGGRSPGTLYLEYRARRSLDALLFGSFSGLRHFCLSTRAEPLVYLRLLITDRQVLSELFPDRDWSNTQAISYLLDFQPQTTGTRCDSGLRPGHSWSDPSGRLEVSWTRADDLSRASVSVAITR